MSFYIEAKSEAEPSVRDCFVHILEEIESIESTLVGISEQHFGGDEFRRLAMERMFEIIGIASDHIPAAVKAQEPEVDWQAIAELSNRLGNALDRIETKSFGTWPMKSCHRCGHARSASFNISKIRCEHLLVLSR